MNSVSVAWRELKPDRTVDSLFKSAFNQTESNQAQTITRYSAERRPISWRLYWRTHTEPTSSAALTRQQEASEHMCGNVVLLQEDSCPAFSVPTTRSWVCCVGQVMVINVSRSNLILNLFPHFDIRLTRFSRQRGFTFTFGLFEGLMVTSVYYLWFNSLSFTSSVCNHLQAPVNNNFDHHHQFLWCFSFPCGRLWQVYLLLKECPSLIHRGDIRAQQQHTDRRWHSRRHRDQWRRRTSDLIRHKHSHLDQLYVP